MDSKTCMNKSCGRTTGDEWRKGWPLRSGGYADLCNTCGESYDNMVFCDTFHLEEPGWRECYLCGKRLHCGCIASASLLELLDSGGVECTNCSKSYKLHSFQNDKIPNGFGSLRVNNAGSLESIVENRVNRNEEEKITQLCGHMEATESNLLQRSETDTISCIGKFKQGDSYPTGGLGAEFSTTTQLPIGSHKFAKQENLLSVLDMSNVNGALAQPSLNMMLGVPPGNANFLAYSNGTVEGREQTKSPSQFQQVHRARTILPKPSKPGNAIISDTSKVMIPELRIARPPGEGRGKSQLLPRYWPRITDQELQQLSGDLNSNIVPLFEKVLSASDAGRIGRLVLPKACAEAYFPSISQSEGVPLRIRDVKGREWTFQFRFWPNNNSRMYVLEGVTPCIQSMQLRAGDTITFSRIDPGGKLVVGYRKSMNNSQDTQDAETSGFPSGAPSGETSFSADGDIGWNKIENNGGRVIGESLQQQVHVSEKKRARNIGPKSKRLLMHSDDALELRLTWEEAQDLLRPPPTAEPSIVTIEDHEFEEYEEPPVFGKRTVFIARPSGGQEQWAQCDDCSKWRKLPVDAFLPPKWTCSENFWDSSRSTCSALEEISSKELENLLRMSKDFKKRRTMENQKRPAECEPSGLDALASAAVLEENVYPESSSVGATTKHPRHRAGCTCIVCIQPPSGKGKHKPTCTCNVCMTVKRRFKTLMLRKKKLQSERESGILKNGSNDHTDEPETNLTSENAVLHANEDNNRIQSGKQIEVAETSTGQIDLNSHPNRDDMQVDVQGLRLISHTDASHHSLDDYVKQNPFSNLVLDEQGSMNSGFCQANDDSLRPLSDDALLASLGWRCDGKGD